MTIKLYIIDRNISYTSRLLTVSESFQCQYYCTRKGSLVTMGPEVLQKKLEEEVEAYKKIQKGRLGHSYNFKLISV